MTIDRHGLDMMINSQPEMQWLLHKGNDITEISEFIELFKRVQNICCENVYIQKYLKDKYLGHRYISFSLICKILRYRKWNQYYYSQMTDKELSNIIVLQIKKSYIEERKESVERIFV